MSRRLEGHSRHQEGLARSPATGLQNSRSKKGRENPWSEGMQNSTLSKYVRIISRCLGGVRKSSRL